MRLFVAVEPPPDVFRSLRALPRPELGGIRWTSPETWHLTLRFLGEVAEPEVVEHALAEADLGPPVEVRLGPETERLNRNVLVVRAEGLDDLAERVRSATAELGQPPDTRPFAAHLTIARRRRRARTPIPTGAPVDAGFVADEVVLFSSTLSDTGAIHEPLRRFPLVARS